MNELATSRDSETSSSPAVFLDRDGTIIEDRGHLSDPSQVVFLDDTVPALLRLSERYKLFIVTNQSGVARGVITLADVDRVNKHVASYLDRHGIEITQTYVCPHERSDGCGCIKPKPYFLKIAREDHGVDLARSFSIGDHLHDAEFAESAGGTGIFVLAGHGAKHRAELPEGTLVAEGIREAVDLITDQSAN